MHKFSIPQSLSSPCLFLLALPIHNHKKHTYWSCASTSASCEVRGSVMVEDGKGEEKRQLDLCAKGFEVRRLRCSMGSKATKYTTKLEIVGEELEKPVRIGAEGNSITLCNRIAMNGEVRCKML